MGHLTCTRNCSRKLSDHVFKRSANVGTEFVGPILKSLMKHTGLTCKHRVQLQHMGVWDDTLSKFALDHNTANDQNAPVLGYVGVPQGSHQLQYMSPEYNNPSLPRPGLQIQAPKYKLKTRIKILEFKPTPCILYI